MKMAGCKHLKWPPENELYTCIPNGHIISNTCLAYIDVEFFQSPGKSLVTGESWHNSANHGGSADEKSR